MAYSYATERSPEHSSTTTCVRIQGQDYSPTSRLDGRQLKLPAVHQNEGRGLRQSQSRSYRAMSEVFGVREGPNGELRPPRKHAHLLARHTIAMNCDDPTSECGMAPIAENGIPAVFTATKIERLGFHCVILHRSVVSALVAAVAEGLIFTSSARAPVVALPYLNWNRIGTSLRDDRF